MRYYQIEDDVYVDGRWYLNGLRDGLDRELDSRDFTYSRKLGPDGGLRISLYEEEREIAVELPLKMRLRRKGQPLDITFADFDVPIVTRAVGEVIRDIAHSDIQLFPVRVGSRKEEYQVLNIISRPDCIDKEHSEIEWWTEEDDEPDKVGQPRMVCDLRIDANRVGGAHILRPAGWDVVVIVSDVLKTALERAEATGVRFAEV